MSILSADVGNAAPGHKISHGGITYEFRLLDYTRLCEWERRRYDMERQRLHERKDDIPAEAFDRKRLELYEKYETHAYSIQTDPYRATLEGTLLMMSIITRRSEEENWWLLQARPDETKDLLLLVLRESFPKFRAEPMGEADSAEDLPQTNGHVETPRASIATTEPV